MFNILIITRYHSIISSVVSEFKSKEEAETAIKCIDNYHPSTDIQIEALRLYKEDDRSAWG